MQELYKLNLVFKGSIINNEIQTATSKAMSNNIIFHFCSWHICMYVCMYSLAVYTYALAEYINYVTPTRLAPFKLKAKYRKNNSSHVRYSTFIVITDQLYLCLLLNFFQDKCLIENHSTKLTYSQICVIINFIRLDMPAINIKILKYQLKSKYQKI